MSPSFAYIAIWSLVICLHSLNLIAFYEEINFQFIWMQISIFVFLLFSEILVKVSNRGHRYSLKRIAFDARPLNRVNKVLLPILVIMFLVDSLYSGGFPLIWILLGDGRSHGDFGMPTFHGLFHGLLLFFVSSSFLMVRLKCQPKKNMRHVLLFVLYVVFVFNRGIIIIFGIQAVFIYIITSQRISFSRYIKMGMGTGAAIYIFGLLGNLRSGGNVFANAIGGEGSQIFGIIPESLIWFYVYATGGLNNLLHNLEMVTPSYLPIYTFAKLLPTVGYQLLGLPQTYGTFELADGRLTVATAFQGLVSDFGIIGIFFYVPLLVLAQVAYRKSLKRSSIGAILFYAMLMQTIIMSPYVDTIFYLTFLLQLTLVGLFSLRTKTKEFSRIRSEIN